jgi:hypothetical protein
VKISENSGNESAGERELVPYDTRQANSSLLPTIGRDITSSALLSFFSAIHFVKEIPALLAFPERTPVGTAHKANLRACLPQFSGQGASRISPANSFLRSMPGMSGGIFNSPEIISLTMPVTSATKVSSLLPKLVRK